MKFHKLFLSLLATASLLAACEEGSDDLGEALISADKTEIPMDAGVGEQTLKLKATRNWSVQAIPDWIAVDPSFGKGSTTPQDIIVSVLSNKSYDRSDQIVFTIGFSKVRITVNQAGELGVLEEGEGTVDSPYSVVKALSVTSALASGGTTSPVFVRGIVSQMAGIDLTYGNATYYISDDGSTVSQLEVYRGYSAGGARFSAEDELKVGDAVTIYGSLVNFRGTTPEFTSGSKIATLNGKDYEVGAVVGTPSGDGSAANPYNVAGVATAAQALSSSEQVDNVYTKGIISAIDGIDTSYGNATYYISDDGSTKGQFEVYRGYSLGGAKFKSESEIKVGDEVVVCGTIVNFRGNTIEYTTGSKIVSLNGNEAAPDEPGSGSDQGGEFASNVTWSVSSGSSSYSELAVVNGTPDVPVLKLGKGSANGSATFSIPAGTSKISFYAISWKNNPAVVQFEIGGSQVGGDFTPAANDGLSNTSPYTLTVSDSDKYSLDLGSAVTSATTVTVKTTGSAYRAALFAVIAE